MNVTVLVAPPVEPVSLDEVKLFLRLDGAEHPDDSMLLEMIQAAREDCEKATGRAFVEQTLRLVTDRFPAACAVRNYIELAYPPVAQIVRVRYFDTDGTLQTVDPANYFVTTDLAPRLMFVSGFAAPSTQCRGDAVQIDYIAGYAPVDSADYVSNVPSGIRHAVKIGVQLMYDELAVDKREALQAQQASLLNKYKVWYV